MARNSGHLSLHEICGLTPDIKMAENMSRRRSRNVLDYSELNALSSVVLYHTLYHYHYHYTSKRKKTEEIFDGKNHRTPKSTFGKSYFRKLWSPYVVESI